jgi:hypothetical protein
MDGRVTAYTVSRALGKQPFWGQNLYTVLLTPIGLQRVLVLCLLTPVSPASVLGLLFYPEVGGS